jgi:hypothetical protein
LCDRKNGEACRILGNECVVSSDSDNRTVVIDEVGKNKSESDVKNKSVTTSDFNTSTLATENPIGDPGIGQESVTEPGIDQESVTESVTGNNDTTEEMNQTTAENASSPTVISSKGINAFSSGATGTTTVTDISLILDAHMKNVNEAMNNSTEDPTKTGLEKPGITAENTLSPTLISSKGMNNFSSGTNGSTTVNDTEAMDNSTEDPTKNGLEKLDISVNDTKAMDNSTKDPTKDGLEKSGIAVNDLFRREAMNNSTEYPTKDGLEKLGIAVNDTKAMDNSTEDPTKAGLEKSDIAGRESEKDKDKEADKEKKTITNKNQEGKDKEDEEKKDEEMDDEGATGTTTVASMANTSDADFVLDEWKEAELHSVACGQCPSTKSAVLSFKSAKIHIRGCLVIGDESSDALCLSPFLGDSACSENICGDVMKCSSHVNAVKEFDGDVVRSL